MGQQPLNAKQVFDRALEIESRHEREAYLSQACAGSSDLRSTVEALLQSYEKAGSFLEAPAAATSDLLDQSIQESPGTMIGPYKLLQKIGEGGMGTVFMAEQTHPVDRKVALKIIKLGMDSRQVIARFSAEQHALALMEHPNIAKVLDAGMTETGRPYFVMELVKGIPITRYCDECHLTPRQRLELFIPVCHAIQHAHQKGIIHRDLKPSNILIALYDQNPVPKVIDFGVAKATGPRITEHTLFTEFGQMLGTVQYMSPEQAGLNQLDIDTRSDVYSLGVLLYELLTGSTPLEHKRVTKAAVLETLRLVREEEAPRPSTRLSTTDEAASISANRGLEPRKLSGLVRGELDWIVMKAIEKDRSRRYETASGLARDVERYLHDEPVEACPPTAAYRFRKFARRNKTTLGVGVAVGLLVLLVVVGLAINNRLVTRERDQKIAALTTAVAEKSRADENLALARRAVNDFLTRVANNARLQEADFHELRRSLLESAIPFYQQFLNQKSDDPKLEVERGRAYGDLADVRQQLGELDQALDAVQHRLAVFDALVGRFPSNPAYRHELANSHRGVATAFLDLSQHAKAEPEFQSAIALLEKLVSEFPAEGVYRQDLAGAYSNLAVMLRTLGRGDDALGIQQKAVSLREQLTNEFPAVENYQRDFAESLSNLSNILFGLEKNDQALASNQRAVELLARLAAEHPNIPEHRERWGSSLDNRATLLCAVGRRDDGLVAQLQAIRINEPLAADFPSVPGYRHSLALSFVNLCMLQAELDRLPDSLASCNRSIVILEKLNTESPGLASYQETFATALHCQAQLLGQLNRLDEALLACGKALAIQEKLAAKHPSVPKLRDDLNLMRTTMGNLKLTKQQPPATTQAVHPTTTEGIAP
jgi:serine/threonine protein kinase/tetratricopeptide (TPR) repeat protein